MQPERSRSYPDSELLQRYRETGKTQWLGLLYERYMELVYGLCLKYLKDAADAEDAVMGIFEELVKKVPRHEIREFRPWLYVLAKNYCLMELRRKSRKREEPLTPEVMHSELIEHPMFEVSENGRLQALENCLEQLVAQQQSCIRLFYLEGKSYKEIAELQQEDLNKVRSYIQNGRRNLRNCMDGLGDE